MYIAALRNAEKRGKQENRRKELVVRSSVGKIMEASITEQIALNFYRRALFFHFTLSFFPPAPFVFFFFFSLFQYLSVNFTKQSSARFVIHARRANCEFFRYVFIQTHEFAPTHKRIEIKYFFSFSPSGFVRIARFNQCLQLKNFSLVYRI